MSETPAADRDEGSTSGLAMLGVALLMGVLLLCVPTTVPRLAGYEVYEVLSESMEPYIPAGSAIFCKGIEPAEISTSDVIAFRSNGDVVVRRVAVNRPSIGEFVTRADMNSIDDPRPVAYEAMVGKVYASVPVLGRVMSFYTGERVRPVLVGAVVIGVLLVTTGPRLSAWRRRRRARSNRMGVDRRLHRSGLRTAALVALTAALVGGAAYLWYGVEESARRVETLASSCTRVHPVAGELAPLEVDFEGLHRVNGDIVGWLYCPDTALSCPVVYGEHSLAYQMRDHTGAPSLAGSTWVDERNSPSFSDARTLVYGKDLTDELPFSTLSAWEDQSYARAHASLWLSTPYEDYRVDLIAVCRVRPTSALFEYVSSSGTRLDALLRLMRDSSLISFDGDASSAQGEAEDVRYLSLSTYDLMGTGERLVLTGRLEPVERTAS